MALGMAMSIALYIYRDGGDLLTGSFLFAAQWILIAGVVFDSNDK